MDSPHAAGSEETRRSISWPEMRIAWRPSWGRRRSPMSMPESSFSREQTASKLERGAVRIVHDAREAAAVIAELLANPAARARMGASGRQAVDDNRGALDRLMAFIEPLLP